MWIKTVNYIKRNVAIHIHQAIYRWGIAYAVIMIVLGGYSSRGSTYYG